MEEPLTINNQFESLLLDRHLFEIEVYDYLVNPFLFISEDFWDSVKVGLTLEQISSFHEINVEETCVICTDDYTTFSEVQCCKNKLCKGCTEHWFAESVRCPFCVQDLRDFI